MLEDPQILGGTVRNLVAMAIWPPDFVHPFYISYSNSHRKTGGAAVPTVLKYLCQLFPTFFLNTRNSSELPKISRSPIFWYRSIRVVYFLFDR